MSWALNTERWDTGTRENANYALGRKVIEGPKNGLGVVRVQGEDEDTHDA